MTPQQAKELFTIDEGGILRWRNRTSIRIVSGQIAGRVGKDKYWSVSYMRKKYLVHRIIWAIHHGEWPPGVIDHINGITTDNRIENLRCGTRRDNMNNLKYHRDGRLAGTFFRKGRWYAQIKVDGKCKSLGGYSTQMEAHLAYSMKKQELDKA